MEKEKDTLSIVWQGLTIDIEHTPDYSPAIRKTYGWTLSHLSITRRDGGKLPVTETGYRSHFTSAAAIAEYGGAKDYVRAWLTEAAQSKTWKDHISKEGQLTLF